MKKMLIIGGIIFVIIVSLMVVQMNKVGTTKVESDDIDNQNASVEIVDFESCVSAGNPVMESYPRQCSDDGNVFVEEVEMNEELETSDVESIETAELVAVGGYVGTARATRTFGGERFFHTVAADIGDPADGKFYEGWLVNGSQFFSTGKMIQKDGEYYLEYLNEQDQSTFNQVVITEETLANGLDGKPETHVFEGGF